MRQRHPRPNRKSVCIKPLPVLIPPPQKKHAYTHARAHTHLHTQAIEPAISSLFFRHSATAVYDYAAQAIEPATASLDTSKDPRNFLVVGAGPAAQARHVTQPRNIAERYDCMAQPR